MASNDGFSDSLGNSDSRKRKLNSNDDNEDDVKIKIAKSSLGLSLLQSYDEDLPDDYLTSDDESSMSEEKPVETLPITSKNIFIEVMTDEDQVEENEIDDSVSVPNIVQDVAEIEAPKSQSANEISDQSNIPFPSADGRDESGAFEDVPPLGESPVEESADKLNKNVSLVPAVTESLPKGVEDAHPEEEPTDPKKPDDDSDISAIATESIEPAESISEEKEEETQRTFEIGLLDCKSSDFLEATTHSAREPIPDVRPDYNFSVFGTQVSDVGSSDDKVSGKPAKKVKLNRSKFVRSIDESSNDTKSNMSSSTSVLPTVASVAENKVSDDVNKIIESPEVDVAVSESRLSLEMSEDSSSVGAVDVPEPEKPVTESATATAAEQSPKLSANDENLTAENSTSATAVEKVFECAENTVVESVGVENDLLSDSKAELYDEEIVEFIEESANMSQSSSENVVQIQELDVDAVEQLIVEKVESPKNVDVEDAVPVEHEDVTVNLDDVLLTDEEKKISSVSTDNLNEPLIENKEIVLAANVNLDDTLPDEKEEISYENVSLVDSYTVDEKEEILTESVGLDDAYAVDEKEDVVTVSMNVDDLPSTAEVEDISLPILNIDNIPSPAEKEEISLPKLKVDNESSIVEEESHVDIDVEPLAAEKDASPICVNIDEVVSMAEKGVPIADTDIDKLPSLSGEDENSSMSVSNDAISSVAEPEEVFSVNVNLSDVTSVIGKEEVSSSSVDVDYSPVVDGRVEASEEIVNVDHPHSSNQPEETTITFSDVENASLVNVETTVRKGKKEKSTAKSVESKSIVVKPQPKVPKILIRREEVKLIIEEDMEEDFINEVNMENEKKSARENKKNMLEKPDKNREHLKIASEIETKPNDEIVEVETTIKEKSMSKTDDDKTKNSNKDEQREIGKVVEMNVPDEDVKAVIEKSDVVSEHNEGIEASPQSTYSGHQLINCVELSDGVVIEDTTDVSEKELDGTNSEKLSDIYEKSSSVHEQSSVVTVEEVSQKITLPTLLTPRTNKNREPSPGISMVEKQLVTDVVVSSTQEISIASVKIDPTEPDSRNDTSPLETLSKLEQALTRKPKSIGKSDGVELEEATEPEVQQISASQTGVQPKEPPVVKENLKLHLSVQGNRVSIKKNVAVEAAPVVKPAFAPASDAESDLSQVANCEPPLRVKRQYRKRPKPVIDPALLTEEKSYTLRTRNTKNPPEEASPKKTKISRKGAVDTVGSAKKEKDKFSRELLPPPVTVEIDPPPDDKKINNSPGKVRPIRLKIKNPGVTIECTSKYSPVTIEKIGGPAKGAVSENIVGILEEARKKDLLASASLEQPTWSGTDLQRVERLLKESNITITPVISSSSKSSSSSSAETTSPSSNSILKPILTAAKEKCARKLMPKTALPSSSSSSSCSTSGGASITPILGGADGEDVSGELSVSRNLNVIIKPLDFEEQLSQWKIAKPGSEMDVIRISPAVAKSQNQSQPHVDVKSEIRKKIAISERRRQMLHEPEVVVIHDSPPKAAEISHRSKSKGDFVQESKLKIKETARKSKSRLEDVVREPKPKADKLVDDVLRANVEEVNLKLTSKADDVIYEGETSAEPSMCEVKRFVERVKDETPSMVGKSTSEPEVIELDAEDEPAECVSPADSISDNVAHELASQAARIKIKASNVAAKSEPRNEAAATVELNEEVQSVGDTLFETKPELKPVASDTKPKAVKTLPDLLPINVSAAESSTQITQHGARSAIASGPQTTPATPSATTSATSHIAPTAPELQMTTVPQLASSPHQMPFMPATSQGACSTPQFAPQTPQSALIAPHMPQSAFVGSQTPQNAFMGSHFGHAPQMASAPSFMMSPMGTPMSSMSMTPGSPMMVDGGVNALPRPFMDAATPYSSLPPLMFPKKRGRPTKAMVAAREAYRQSQEAIEMLKKQHFDPTLPLMAPESASTPAPPPPPPTPPTQFITFPDDSSQSPDTLKSKRGRKPKLEKPDKTDGSGDSSLAESLPPDPEREMEELKRQEEDRIRKEQERERKNEIRRLKAKERSDMEKAKKERQRQKAEERHKKMQEQRRLLQEQKKKLEEEIKNLPGFDAGRTSAGDSSQMSNASFGIDEDSSSMTFDSMQRVKKGRMEVHDSDGNNLTVDQIAEYQWPIQGGELYMIQEQISNFLGVKSFKRKYPDIKRRSVDSEERAYLVDSGLVSETLCDLGITAVCSAEVLDIMCSDFADKYEELRRYMREKQMKELSFKQKAWANGLGYKLFMADGSKQDLKKRAMESVSSWNSALNKSRREDRRSAIDLQTFIIHYPKSRTQNLNSPSPKVGSYPVSILPGQFCDFYKEYTSTELRYMPLNTVLYGPVRHPSAAKDIDGSQTDSDDSSSSDESSSTTSEGTQNTEDTLEDADKDMSLDESLLAEKLPDANASVQEGQDVNRREMTNGASETAAAGNDGKVLCKICLGDEGRNKENVPEVLIYCSQCCSSSHPTCLDLSLNMVPHIKSYKWQCPDCKNCARCKEYADEDKMLFCDICDRGYHIYCVGLRKVPSGSWQCQECTSVSLDPPNSGNVMPTPSMNSSIPIKIEG